MDKWINDWKDTQKKPWEDTSEGSTGKEYSQETLWVLGVPPLLEALVGPVMRKAGKEKN